MEFTVEPLSKSRNKIQITHLKAFLEMSGELYAKNSHDKWQKNKLLTLQIKCTITNIAKRIILISSVYM